MHQLNQVEAKLKEMEGGKFQVLCNEILYRLGYELITNSGGQIGTDKTIKGTPDAYILNNDGSFTFVEYTVRQSNVLDKFKDDVNKCLDESKTNVAIDKIETIILMYNSILSVGDINELLNICERHNVKLLKFDISNISLIIYTQLPYLTKEFLGINIDSGQFLDYESFVNRGKNSMFATPLDIKIIGRQEEVNDIVTLLKRSSMVMLAGISGVGKTRVALEALKIADEQLETTKIWYVKDLGMSLYDDLIKYTATGNHIIYIDDINKLTAIDSVLLYISDNTTRIKLLATVRDYALDTTMRKLIKYDKPEVYQIKKVENEVIKKISRENFNIRNDNYLDRIVKLADGNTRLAVMMSIIAVNENTLKSISNVSELLSNYYSHIRDKLDKISDISKMKALGILSFFNKIHIGDQENILSICSLLNIRKEELFRCYKDLFHMELVDIYEDEVISVSDQILSIFIFQYVFENMRIIEYSELIKTFFPKYRNRIIQNINSITSYYDNIKFFKEEIKLVWDEWETSNNEHLVDLILTFWFVKEATTLSYIFKHIQQTKLNLTLSQDYKISSKNNYSINDILKTLGLFSRSENYNIAIDILINYLEKDYTMIKDISYTLINYYGYDKYSYREGYSLQYELISRMYDKALSSNNKVFFQLFANLASSFLTFGYEYTEQTNSKSFSFITITLYNHGKMKDIRELIWKFVNYCFKSSEYKIYANHILDTYKTNRYYNYSPDLYECDFKLVNKYVIRQMNHNSFSDCLLIEALEKNIFKQINKDFDILEKRSTDLYNLYKLLTTKILDYDEDWVIAREKRQRELCGFAHALDEFKLLKFINQCKVIEQFIDNHYDFNETLSIILSEYNNSLECIRLYLNENVTFNINPSKLIEKAITEDGFIQILEEINKCTFVYKEYWEYILFAYIPKEDINKQIYDKLLSYFTLFVNNVVVIK